MGIKTKLNVRLAIRQRADLFEANILANKISLLQGQSLERTSRFHLRFEWTCAFKCFYFTTIKACLKMPRMLCLCLVPRRLSLSKKMPSVPCDSLPVARLYLVARGALPFPKLFVRNHKYGNRCMFTITTNCKNLSPHPQN